MWHDQSYFIDRRLHYKYIVNGQKYASSRRHFLDEFTLKKNSAEETLKRYSGLEQLKIGYNPKHPDESILESKPFDVTYELWFAFWGFLFCLLTPFFEYAY